MIRRSLATACGGLVVMLAVRAGAVPKIDTPVTDQAGVVDASHEEQIAKVLALHRAATGVQIAVLVVNTTSGQPIDDFGIAVFERWRGGSKQRNDGVLLTLAVKDRTSRIDVGYDLEDVLTDGRSKQILDGMRPELRSGDYGAALLGAVNNIIRVTQGLEPVVAYTPTPTSSSASEEAAHTGRMVMVVVGIVVLCILLFMFAVITKGSVGGSSSGWSSGSSWSNWSSGSSGGSSSSSSSPRSSGGSSYSSSGWSGGGGSSGGGGASSSW